MKAQLHKFLLKLAPQKSQQKEQNAGSDEHPCMQAKMLKMQKCRHFASENCQMPKCRDCDAEMQ
jgi:hypothetical protein